MLTVTLVLRTATTALQTYCQNIHKEGNTKKRLVDQPDRPLHGSTLGVIKP